MLTALVQVTSVTVPLMEKVLTDELGYARQVQMSADSKPAPELPHVRSAQHLIQSAFEVAHGAIDVGQLIEAEETDTESLEVRGLVAHQGYASGGLQANGRKLAPDLMPGSSV